jgi:hypothetical protein
LFCFQACDTLFPQVNQFSSIALIFFLTPIIEIQLFKLKLYGGKDPKKMGIVLQKALIIGFISMFFSGALLLNCRNLMFLFVDSKNVARCLF